MTAQAQSETHLRGLWLAVARVGWIAVAVLVLGASFTHLPGHFDQLLGFCLRDRPALEQLGLPVGLCAGSFATFSLVFLVGYSIAAVFIFWRRSDDWMGLITSLVLLGIGPIWTSLNMLMTIPPRWQLPVGLVRAIVPGSFSIYFYLFPDGRFIPRWTRGLAVVSVAFALSGALFPASPFNPYNVNTWASPLGPGIWLVWIGVGVFAQIYRYLRVSTPVQRQQTKWNMFGLLVFFPMYAASVTPLSIFPSVGQPGLSRLLYTLVAFPGTQLSLLFVLVCLGISILRYRLWDIDLIIRRTLVYSLLSSLLVLTYFVLVVILQRLFTRLTGQDQNQLVAVLSTLAIAALFLPLRRRVQDAIDRSFYRKKYDAQKVLAEFAATARDETDLDRLTARLVEVVQETMQPETISLWLKPTDRGRS
jgi:hypothetical protein